MQTKLEFMLSV